MAAGGAIPPAAGSPLRGTARSPRHGSHGTEPPPRQPVRAGRARVRVPPRTHHSDGGHHVGGGARPAAGAAAAAAGAGAGPAALPCRPPACRAAFLGRADVSGGGAPRTRLGAAPARPPRGRAGAGSPLRAPPSAPGQAPAPCRSRPPPFPCFSLCPHLARGAARPHPAPSDPRWPPRPPAQLPGRLPAPCPEQRCRAGGSGSGCLG